MEDLKQLDRKTRKLQAVEKMHYPKAYLDRLYPPRTSGGGDLIQTETTYKTTTIGLDTYTNNNADMLLDIIRDHEGVRSTP